MWAEDVDDSEFVGGSLVSPQQAYIKEYDRSDMRERIVIEFHSEKDKEDFMNELQAMGYVRGDIKVKVCGMGMCGHYWIYGK